MTNEAKRYPYWVLNAETMLDHLRVRWEECEHNADMRDIGGFLARVASETVGYLHNAGLTERHVRDEDTKLRPTGDLSGTVNAGVYDSFVRSLCLHMPGRSQVVDFINAHVRDRLSPVEGFVPFYAADVRAWDSRPSRHSEEQRGLIMEGLFLFAIRQHDPLQREPREALTDHLDDVLTAQGVYEEHLLPV